MIGQILSYSIASSTVLVCLYITYFVFMRKTTFFGFNRVCIINIYILAAIAPLVSLNLTDTTASIIGLPAETTGVTGLATHYAGQTPSVIYYALWIYAIGAGLCGLRFATDALYICYLRVNARAVVIDDKEVLIHDKHHIAPFSWGGRIYMPSTLLSEECTQLRMIIDHEQSHLNNHHWVDLLISNAFIVLQWYNPSAWLMHSELISVHEYEADRCVVRHTDDPIAYQLLLIKKTAGNRFHAIADSLNHSSLKKRITMMMKNQTKSRARLRALAMLPAMAAALCLINSSCVKDAQNAVKIDNEQEAETQKTVQIVDDTASEPVTATEEAIEPTSIESRPEYPGGISAFYNEITKALNWEDGMKEGRVVVQFTIDEKGNMSEPKILKGISPLNDKCAIEAIKKISTKWIPAKNADGVSVNVTYTVPIIFKTN